MMPGFPRHLLDDSVQGTCIRREHARFYLTVGYLVLVLMLTVMVGLLN